MGADSIVIWCVYQARNGRFDICNERYLQDCYASKVVLRTTDTDKANARMVNLNAWRSDVWWLGKVEDAHCEQLKRFGVSVYTDKIPALRAEIEQKWQRVK